MANKWQASERAMARAARILDSAGVRPRAYGMDASGKCGVECTDAAQAAEVARLTRGKVARAGTGHAANTVLVAP